MDIQNTQNVDEKKELSKSQKIKQKIAELKKLEKIEKDISTYRAKIEKLKEQKRELERKYDI